MFDFSFLRGVLDFSVLRCGWLWRKGVKSVVFHSIQVYDGNGHFLFSPRACNIDFEFLIVILHFFENL